MVPEKERYSSDSEPEGLKSKKELAKLVGITPRKLTYWQDEGVISPPVLYKGQGGKSFYDISQFVAAHDLVFLQDECRQSTTDIKRIIHRVKEDFPNSILIDKPEFCLSMFLDCHSRKYLKDNLQILDQYKNGMKVLVVNSITDIFLIDFDRCQTRYTNRNGNILKIIREDEFDPLWFTQAEPIDKFVESVMYISFETGCVLSPEAKSQSGIRKEISIKLIQDSVILPPAYYYSGKEFYSQPDIDSAGFLVSFAQEHGFEKTASLVERIKEDISIFFCFPSESKEYSAFFLRFKRDVELIREAILELHDIKEEGPYGCCDEWSEVFFERFLEGQIRMKPNCIDNRIMFQKEAVQDPGIQTDGTHLAQK